MKKVYKYIVFLIFAMIQAYNAFSQNGNVFNFDFTRDLDEQLPPLDSLMIIAHERSPMVLKYAALFFRAGLN